MLQAGLNGMGKYTGPIAETVISGLNTQLMKSRQNKQSVGGEHNERRALGL